MFANPAMPKLDEPKHGFAAASAPWLPRLQRRTTLIAKHLLFLSSPSSRFDTQWCTMQALNSSDQFSVAQHGTENLLSKRKGHPATWAAFSFKGE
jgi:hypothetical protein